MKQILVGGCAMVLALIVMDTTQVVKTPWGKGWRTNTRRRFADAAAYRRASRQGERWGNRPASLWKAEDFGCCASG